MHATLNHETEVLETVCQVGPGVQLFWRGSELSIPSLRITIAPLEGEDERWALVSVDEKGWPTVTLLKKERVYCTEALTYVVGGSRVRAQARALEEIKRSLLVRR